uniref:Putative vesicle coat complex copi alpha subunit n=1 Tax=Amblyomma aureolatum TaxID=187763 RepID=A0A1E1WWI5_9ACAR
MLNILPWGRMTYEIFILSAAGAVIARALPTEYALEETACVTGHPSSLPCSPLLCPSRPMGCRWFYNDSKHACFYGIYCGCSEGFETKDMCEGICGDPETIDLGEYKKELEGSGNQHNVKKKKENKKKDKKNKNKKKKEKKDKEKGKKHKEQNTNKENTKEGGKKDA